MFKVMVIFGAYTLFCLCMVSIFVMLQLLVGSFVDEGIPGSTRHEDTPEQVQFERWAVENCSRERGYPTGR